MNKYVATNNTTSGNSIVYDPNIQITSSTAASSATWTIQYSPIYNAQLFRLNLPNDMIPFKVYINGCLATVGVTCSDAECWIVDNKLITKILISKISLEYSDCIYHYSVKDFVLHGRYTDIGTRLISKITK
jgi:hypothetical protein